MRGGRRPDLRAIDHEDVGVAAASRTLCGPCPRTRRAPRRHSPSEFLAHPLQPRVSEVGGVGIDGRIIVGVFEHDGDVALAGKARRIVSSSKLFVARLDRVAKLDPVQLFGKQVDERRDVVAVEPSAGRELPQDRASFGPSAAKPCAKKSSRPSCASASFDRMTQKREPLTANWKPSGATFSQLPSSSASDGRRRSR